jgi:hypothetical protein
MINALGSHAIRCRFRVPGIEGFRGSALYIYIHADIYTRRHLLHEHMINALGSHAIRCRHGLVEFVEVFNAVFTVKELAKVLKSQNTFCV